MKPELNNKWGDVYGGQLKEDKNIILALDNHASTIGARSIAKFYHDLASRYGLQLASFEGDRQDSEIPARAQFTTWESTQRYLSRYGSHMNASDMVTFVAVRQGFSLKTVKAGLDSNLGRIQMLCILANGNGSELLAEVAPTTPELLLSRARELAGNYNWLFPDLDHQLAGLPVTDQTSHLSKVVSYERTRQQIEALSQAMDQNGCDISFAIRGSSHVVEFVEISHKLDIGYGILVPKGMRKINSRLGKKHTDKLKGIFNDLMD